MLLFTKNYFIRDYKSSKEGFSISQTVTIDALKLINTTKGDLLQGVCDLPNFDLVFVRMLAVLCHQNDTCEKTMNRYQARKNEELKT